MKTHEESRATRALSAISAAVAAGHEQAALFVTHHLEELKPSYWQERVGTPTPTSDQVLALLVLANDLDDDVPEVLDFTLPGDVTQYVLCVTFDDVGEVEQITLES